MRLSAADRQAKIALIEKWKRSGLSQKDFYLQEDIPAHSFYYWLKYYRDHVGKTSTSSSGGFVELTPSALPAAIEVQFPNGTRVIFNHPVSADFLKVLTS